jgi:hypothetical protein
VDALVALFHQILVNVPEYRSAFVRSGGLGSFVRLFVGCGDRDVLGHLYWLLLYFASPDSECEDLEADESVKVLREVSVAIEHLYRHRLFVEFTSVLLWLLERKEIKRELFETPAFEETIELMHCVVTGELGAEESQAVLITIEKIIRYADVGFSIVVIPFEDDLYPLLWASAMNISTRAWWVLTAAVCRDPRWIIPEILRLGVFSGFGDQMETLGFEVKSAAMECATCVLKEASDAEWAHLVGDLCLLTVVLDNLDTAEVRGSAYIDAVCARVATDERVKEAITPFAAALTELSETCTGQGIECPGIDILMRLLQGEDGDG